MILAGADGKVRTDFENGIDTPLMVGGKQVGSAVASERTREQEMALFRDAAGIIK